MNRTVAGRSVGEAKRSGIRSRGPDGRGGKYLTFFLGPEEYGLAILKVQEIIGMMEITPVPRTPEHVLGVINLRGKIIPVVDLRSRFDMCPAQRTPESCIIVADANSVQTGIMVDQVSEVSSIPGDDIEDTPAFGAGVRTDFIMGIGKSDGRVKLLLDIDRALADTNLAEIANSYPAGSAEVLTAAQV